MRTLARMLVVTVALLTAATTMSELAYAQGRSRGGGGGQAVPRGGGAGPTAGPRGGPSGGPRGGAMAPPRTGTAVPRRSSAGAPVVGHAVPRGSMYPGHPNYPIYYGGRYVYGGYPYWGWGGWGGWGWGWGGWGGWWGPGWYGSMWWPGWGWWGPPGPFYAVPYGVTSDARLMVKPRNTEVYVDGALAGVVDSYDGVFQRLVLAPGTHEITLYLEGYKRFTQNVYVAPVSTVKIRHTMEPLPEGAPQDERPTPPVRREPATTTQAPASQPVAAPSGPEVSTPSAAPVLGEAGVLVIRVQPSDAEIFIDGARWQTPDPNRPLEVRLPPGRVKVEVRRPGHAPFSTEVVIDAGQVTPLNVSLPQRGQEP